MADPNTEPTLEPTINQNRWWNIPNALSLIRWLGSPSLIYFGWMQLPQAFVIVYLVLALTDWLDGKIAVRFRLQTTLGARLDSFADATLYVSVLLGGLALWHDRLIENKLWLVMACGSYGLATLLGWLKFGQWPSYHTRTAKISWLFVMVAVGCLAWELPVWPLKLAAVSVTLANLESIAITYRLRKWQTDVISVWVIKDGTPLHREP
jgi:phosphatidylglycerophosphate synthase